MSEARLTIPPALVTRLLAAQFPHWAGLPLRRVARDGWDHSTFRLGHALKVRLPNAARYAAQVAKEHDWLPRLAPHLPLPIPAPVALGAPGCGYLWPWAVQRWLEGTPASAARIGVPLRLARDLAGFLRALQRAPAAGGPAAGAHSFHRGGALVVYDAQTRRCLAALPDARDRAAALTVWQAALAAPWRGPAVWVHGDVAAGNLLLRRGRLCAVLDFGACAVGDPACDLAVAWTLLEGEARQAFRAAMAADAGMWARARGWALWKALLVLAEDGGEHGAARRVIAAVLDEHRAATG
jgi:aminoglycoside phosphotransferase (APT) family kinase protein